MKYRPTGKRILVQKIEKESTSNLIIPNSNDPVIGIIVAAGPLCDTGIKEGDMVMMSQGCKPFPLKDEVMKRDVLLYHESEVIVVIEQAWSDTLLVQLVEHGTLAAVVPGSSPGEGYTVGGEYGED